MIFTIKIHRNYFYNKNALEIILLYKCIGNNFTIQMHWK